MATWGPAYGFQNDARLLCRSCPAPMVSGLAMDHGGQHGGGAAGKAAGSRAGCKNGRCFGHYGGVWKRSSCCVGCAVTHRCPKSAVEWVREEGTAPHKPEYGSGCAWLQSLPRRVTGACVFYVRVGRGLPCRAVWAATGGRACSVLSTRSLTWAPTSTCRKSLRSAPEHRVRAEPFCPARPVRPMRCR